MKMRKVRLGLFAAFLVLTGLATAKADDRLTLVFVGDTGTNASGAPVSEKGGYKAGQLLSVGKALAGIKPWLKGDLIFANLESVVTTDDSIPPRNKMFVFRMHPAGARALARAGFNVFSTANNHAMDFGGRGAADTLTNMEKLHGDGLRAWPGLGRNRAKALEPQRFSLDGAPVAISAFGLGGGGLPAAKGEAGTLRGQRDFKALVTRLRTTEADLRILSVHYGQEFAPHAANSEVAQFREAMAETGGVSVIVGHHQHVARAMEIFGQHLILYGLGNFMHFGTQNMGHFDICRDFGLLARVGLRRMSDGKLKIETVEAVPLTGMHRQTRAMTGEAARRRLDVLNYLGSHLDAKGNEARALRFARQANGSGLWCAADATDTRCRNWVEPPLADGYEGTQIAVACARNVRR